MIKIFLLAILLSLLSTVAARAQICTGSLGDPIINEHFGAGRKILPAYKTTYPYVSGCPSKGSYTLSNFLFGCGGRTWVQMVGDHTLDANGNYLLVNAESQAGTVYMDTAKNICGNTVYQFGLWITSVMTKFACNGTPILPNIKFRVITLSGAILAADSTGYLPIVDAKEWKFYGLSFTTPSGITSAIVRITIDPPFGCGSAFALDDITLRPCGPSVSATIDGTAGPTEVCADYTNSLIMNAAYSPGFADPLLQWQNSLDSGKTWLDIPGETQPGYAVPHRSSGVVEYRVSIAERTNINSVQCRISSNAIYTNIHPVPKHAAPKSVFGCLGKNFFFPATDPFALKVLWSGPNGYNSLLPTAGILNVQYKDSGLYRLVENFNYNCISSDTFFLKIVPGTTISVKPSYPICEGISEPLFASAKDSVGFQWSPSAGLSNYAIPNPVATPSDSTKYKVLITNGYGCKDSAFLQIDVYRKPFANAGADKTILKGDTVVLNGLSKGTAINYYWTPPGFLSNKNSITPLAYPLSSSIYTLSVVSTVGCGIASDEVQVKVYDNFNIPNAFTPNEDGKNDKFRVLVPDNYKLVHLWIYNRWGNLVFSSAGVNTEWDGTFKSKPQPAGAYVYDVKLKADSGREITRKGSILLVR